MDFFNKAASEGDRSSVYRTISQGTHIIPKKTASHDINQAYLGTYKYNECVNKLQHACT